MKHYKSEKLKKLEAELGDLEQWLKLGLVPKRDITKHKEEIRNVIGKIEEEKERLQFLRESGEAEEYVTPKKGQTKAGYTEMPTIPDIDMAETAAGSYHDTDFDVEENEETETGVTVVGEEKDAEVEEEAEEESYFSDKNRWRRGSDIIDPDANDW